MKKVNRKGFTLVELLVTIVILGIITAMSLPLIRNIQESNQKKRFTTYSDGLESSAKLYVDSYSEDLFGHKDGGCAYITWQQLYEKELTKDIQVADMSCNSKNSFVKVVKYKDHYNYYPSLGCGNKKNGAVNKVTVTLPDGTKAQEINEESCGGPNGSSISISANPSGYSKTDRQKIGIDVKITSPTGINTQKSISYAWSKTKSYSTSLNWQKLDIDIPEVDSQEKQIISGNSIEVKAHQISTPTNQTGEYYLVIKVDALSDLFGTPWNEGEADKKNYVTFGKYVIDNTKPVIHSLSATSSEPNFNAVTPKISLNATDALAPTSELKMCYSYDKDNCGKNKSDFKSSKYTKYTASKVLSKIKNNVDGTSHKIYITVVDPAGNYTTKEVGYTISLKYNVSYDFNGGKKGTSAPTVAYADRETTISNPIKTITASFNSNGKGAKISTASSITKNYTFSGWKGEGLASTALTGTNSANTPWKGLPTTNTKFKALANKYDATVKMTANWISPSITLPTISKTGYTCTWNEKDTCNGKLSWNSGATYTPTSANKRTFYTCCTPNTYTLTYNSNSGSACSSKKGKYDSKWGTLCAPKRTGYTFAGWYTGATKVTADMIVKGDLTVTAKWNINSYKLTIDNNGGTGCVSQTKNYNTKWDACTPKRTGYTFKGWDYNFGGQTVTGNKSAKASWQINSYTLTIDNGGGTGCNNQTKKYNTKWDACMPTRTGYTFKEWDYAFGGKTVTGNKTAKASWKIKSYTLTIDNGGGSGCANQTKTYNTKWDSCTPTRTGYTFKGWDYNFGGQTVTGNKTAKAIWTKNTYTLTINTNGGTGCASQSKKYGEEWDSCTPTRTGYTFKEWDYAFGGKKVTGNKTAKASWKIKSYTLTIDNGGGSGCANQTKTYNTKWDSCTPTRTGYTFKGWDYNFGGQTVTGNKTAKAIWTKNTYTLTINTNGGTGCATQSKKYGDKWVACTPTRTGYTFKGWDYDFGGKKVTGNKSATASWKAKGYILTIDNDGGSGCIEQSKSYGSKWDSCTPTRTGYTFKGWDYKFGGQTVTGNKSAKASWQANSYTLTINNNGGTGCNNQSKKYNSKWDSCTPTRTGYTFKSWDYDFGGKKVTGNKSAKASWQAKNYTLTIDNNGGTGCAKQTKAYGSKWDSCTPTKTGYQFNGWSYEFGGQTVTGNKTAKASWKIRTYTLTINNNGGTGCASQTKNYNAKWDACTPTRTGHKFTGWSYNFDGQKATANKSATAGWQANSYTLTIDNNGGTGCAKQTKTYGSTWKSCTPTRSGYTFKGWSYEFGGQTVTGNKTAKASWEVICVDKTKPTVSNVLVSVKSATSATVGFKASDKGCSGMSKIVVKFAGKTQTLSVGSTSATFNNITTQDEYSATVTAYDKAGNTGSAKSGAVCVAGSYKIRSKTYSVGAKVNYLCDTWVVISDKGGSSVLVRSTPMNKKDVETAGINTSSNAIVDACNSNACNISHCAWSSANPNSNYCWVRGDREKVTYGNKNVAYNWDKSYIKKVLNSYLENNYLLKQAKNGGNLKKMSFSDNIGTRTGYIRVPILSETSSSKAPTWIGKTNLGSAWAWTLTKHPNTGNGKTSCDRHYWTILGYANTAARIYPVIEVKEG